MIQMSETWLKLAQEQLEREQMSGTQSAPSTDKAQ
jgi:hypothetical protein